MDIAFLSPALSRKGGGLFEIASALTRHLSARPGTTVTVFGLEDEFSADDSGKWAPVRPVAFPRVGPSNFGYSSALQQEFLSRTADVAHLHALWMYTSILVRQWSTVHRRPYVVTTNGMLEGWALRNSGWKKRIAAVLYERASLNAAGCVQVNSAAELASARAFGLSGPFCIVGNGVELPAPVPATGRPDWLVGEERKVLLFLGRLHSKKGLKELVHAWALLKRRGRLTEGWVLALAGWDDGGYRPMLEAAIDAADLGADVIVPGALHGREKDAALRHADAFILPSFSEGLPIAVLEAWSYSVPVFMTPACNLPEGFSLGAAFEIGNAPEHIADALEGILPDEQALSQAGELGRALVVQRFAWNSVAAQLAEVYAWLSASGPVPDCVVPG